MSRHTIVLHCTTAVRPVGKTAFAAGCFERDVFRPTFLHAWRIQQLPVNQARWIAAMMFSVSVFVLFARADNTKAAAEACKGNGYVLEWTRSDERAQSTRKAPIRPLLL